MLRCLDIACDLANQRVGESERRQSGPRQGGACLLIVPALRVVDGIVKDDRQGHGIAIDDTASVLVEVAQQLRDMLERMILAPRLEIGGNELIEHQLSLWPAR